MSTPPTESPRSATAEPYVNTVPGPNPTISRDLLLMAAGCVSLFLLSWSVVGLVHAAWEECIDIGAGGRFGLTVLYIPGTMIATGIGSALVAYGTRRSHPVLRGVLIVLAVALVALLIIVWQVPYNGESYWADGVLGDEATAECGAGGIPTWWPAWLPT